MTASTPLSLRWGLSSDVGQVRQVNQDSAMANGRLFVVADGMGGHQGGEVASDIAAGHFRLMESVVSVEELATGVVVANEMIRARASVDPNLTGMGTTLVALALTADADGTVQLAAANVGDSRMYRLTNGSLDQVTQDHSLVGELVRAGQLTPDEAREHPQRNVVTRALGVDDAVNVDSWEFPGHLGERYLLCSDGLIDEVVDADIAAAMQSIDQPADVARALVDMANRAGGRDNVTVLIVDVVEAAACAPDETPS